MIEELKKEVEARVEKLRPDFKTILSMYLSRYKDYQVKSVKYSVKFLEFPQVLMKECQYWAQCEIPKPSLETLENLHERIKRDRGEVMIQLKFEEVRQQRNQILKDTDYMFMTDYRFDDQKLKQQFIEYRKYLRDFPGRLDKNSIVNANIPTFDEWKKMRGY